MIASSLRYAGSLRQRARCLLHTGRVILSLSSSPAEMRGFLLEFFMLAIDNIYSMDCLEGMNGHEKTEQKQRFLYLFN